jgi:uncharacterized protein (DUF427 family)
MRRRNLSPCASAILTINTPTPQPQTSRYRSKVRRLATTKMPTATARVGSTTIAQASDYATVEGNIYFPPSSITDKSILQPSSQTSVCPWKGTASYYSLHVDGKTLKDAAWYYPQPKEKVQHIKDYVAFCASKSSPMLNLWRRLTDRADKNKVDISTA